MKIKSFAFASFVLLNVLALTMCKGQNTIKYDTNEDSPYAAGEEVGVVTSDRIAEISGLAPSGIYKDCFWVHNDSATSAHIYLINLSGELVAAISLPVENRDWEAIALGDGYIYLGEVGDNFASNDSKKIYKIAEPTNIDTTARDSEISITIDQIETMEFNLSAGKVDCETLMYDPIDKELVLATKREDKSVIYTTPFVATDGGEVLIIEPSVDLTFTYSTSGDISVDGSKILIKNYTNIYFWERKEGESIVETLKTTPTMLLYDIEPQGEAIAWSTYEDAFYTVSEKFGSINPPIYKYKRK
ncbi:MAG: hypothetical protein SNH55_05960 [Rikenellaceae bacterium]